MPNPIRGLLDTTGLTRPEASQQHMENIAELAKAFAAYQKENEAARQQAMINQLTTMQPMMSQYERMYGAGTAPRLNQFSQSPYPQNRMSMEHLMSGLNTATGTGSKKSSPFENIPILGDLFKGISWLWGDE